MESNKMESQDNNGTKEDNYMEIEIPYTLFQFLSTENCNVQNICRICLSTDNDMLYPLLSSEENNFLADMLAALITIRPTPEDGLPSSICGLCRTLVVQYYEFKIKCEKSQCMLSSILKGEFIAKEEPPDHSIHIKQGESIIDNRHDGIEDEELVEDVQYLEDLSGDANDNEKPYLVEHISKRIRRKLKKAFKGSLNKGHSVKNRLKKKPKSYPCGHCSKVFLKAKTYHMHVKTQHGIKQEKQPYPCSQCNESFNSEHDLTVHSALHVKGTLWKCNQCQKQFTSKTTLRRHLQRHMQSKPHGCASCHKTFTELYALRRHSRVHTGERVEKKHVCHICDKRYSESGLLAAHVARHAGLRPCECATCHKSFPSPRLLASHMLVHTDDKPYACNYCDKRFRHESTRKTHHRTHTGEKPYACSVCGKNFIQNSNLTLHMRTHTGERPYSCNMCERKFTSGSSLKSHQRIHTGERPYSCKVCGKSFARMNLGAHMRQHTGERPFACIACPKRFANASRLREHYRIHTGERPYSCNMCERNFTSGSSLKSHQRIHAGEQPYICQICGKSIARMNLGAHIRYHAGEHPFACIVCPKKFANESRLREHYRIHTGEKPYECANCTYTFATKSHLVKHMKSHDPPEKNSVKCDLIIVQQIPCNPPVADNVIYKEKDDLVIVTENTASTEPNNFDNNITFDIVHEVPLEVTGELILQDDSNMKAELLVVDNSQSNYPISNEDVCLNSGNVNIINGENNVKSEK